MTSEIGQRSKFIGYFCMAYICPTLFYITVTILVKISFTFMDVEDMTVLYERGPGSHLGFIIVKSLGKNILLIMTHLQNKNEENCFQNGRPIGSQSSEFQNAL